MTTDHLPYREDSRTHWQGLKPVSLDPADKTLAKTLTPSAGIVRVFACRDSKNLHLRLDTRAPISPGIDYLFTLRRVTPGGENVPAYILSRPSYSEASLSSPGKRPRHESGYGTSYGSGNHFVGTSYSWEGSTLEVTDTLWGLQHPAAGTMLYLAVETRLHGVAVDATGFRGLLCTPPEPYSMPPETQR